MRRNVRQTLITVGQINVVWDEIDLITWYIFDVLLNVHWSHSYSIYFSQQNSRNRREMVASLANVVLRESPQELKKIEALLEKIQRASTKRNDITHGIWSSEKKGRRTLIKRIPIKRDLNALTTKHITYENLQEIHQQLINVHNELYGYIMPRWRKKNEKHLGDGKHNYGLYDAMMPKSVKQKALAREALT